MSLVLEITKDDGSVVTTPVTGQKKPEDMCLVDLEGNQKAGIKKRTSEILMHLQIMKAQPKAKATVHCHPPYATGLRLPAWSPPRA